MLKMSELVGGRAKTRNGFLILHKLTHRERIAEISKVKQIRSNFRESFFHAAAAAAKSLQLCLGLCNPIDGSPPGSPVPGILHARTLEWVAIAFSNS